MNIRHNVLNVYNSARKNRIIFVLILALIIPITISLLSVRQDPRQRAFETKKNPVVLSAISSTNKIIKESVNLLQLKKLAKDTNSQKDNLITSIKKRKIELKNLLKENPEEFLKLSISENVKKTLPSESQNDIESTISVSGSLIVRHYDYPDNKSEHKYFLMNKTNKYELHPTKELSDLKSGDAIEVTGVKLENDIVIDSNDKNSIKKTDVLGVETVGEQRMAIILVNFLDFPEQPITPSKVKETALIEINNWIKESSYDKAFVTGEVYGWYTLPYNLKPSGCNENQIAEQAWIASNNDIDFTKVDRFMFIINDPQYVCGWGGISDVGNHYYETPQGEFILSNSWAHTNTEPYFTGTMLHELGHALGLWHSNGWECGTASQAKTGCNTVGYGNDHDVMGLSSRFGHFSAHGKETLGWLSHDNIRTVLDSTTLIIAPLESKTDQIQAVKIPVEWYYGNPSNYYYLEYRQPIGFDARLSSDAFAGILINWAPVYKGQSEIQLIDTTPSTAVDFSDSALKPGLIYEDEVYKMQIENLFQNANGVAVKYTANKTECIQLNPTLVVLPMTAQGNPGQTLTYNVRLTNNNINCPASTYKVEAFVPDDFTYKFNNETLTIAPGEIGTATLEVTSGLNSENAFHSVYLYANSEDERFYAYFDITYLVYSFDPNITPGLTGTPYPSITATPTPPFISNVVFQPRSINTSVGAKQTGMSALAYDSSNRPIMNGVTYNWGISSSNSIGRLISITGPIASFEPLRVGVGDIFVTAKNPSGVHTSSMAVVVTGKQGDVNGDSLINLIDLSTLLSNWNSTTFTNADFNRDGRVNLTDLSILLSNWGM